MLRPFVICMKDVNLICKKYPPPRFFIKINEKAVDSPSPLVYNKVA